MTRVHLQPSSFDRLDPVALAIRWWTSQITSIAGHRSRKVFSCDAIDAEAKRLPRRIAIVLGPTDGFSAQVRLPKGHADAHRQALDLRISELTPTAPETLLVTATAIDRSDDGATTYELAMARRNRLDQLEVSARRRGARSIVFRTDGGNTAELVSPKAQRKARARMMIDASIVIAIVVAATTATSLWTAKINADTEALADRERSIRRAAVSIEASRKDGELSRQLVERGVLKRRGSAALEALAALNTATPDNAWWTRIRWTPEEVAISGESSNATATIGALSAAAKSWSIELAGPLTAAPVNGAQAFEILAKPRQPHTP